jgi:hypothetical protein
MGCDIRVTDMYVADWDKSSKSVSSWGWWWEDCGHLCRWGLAEDLPGKCCKCTKRHQVGCDICEWK